MGNVKYGEAPPYHDYETLLRYIRDQGAHEPFIDVKSIAQTGTAAYVELAEVDSQTVADIGKAEVTVQLYGDADDAATNTLTYTLVYLDADGESHTAVGTGTATLNGTPVAFVPAVTDFYEAVSFTASAAQAAVNVSAKVAAGSIFATIAVNTTAATEALLWGVGSITFKSAADNASDRKKDAYLTYLNHLYELKYAICTTGAAATTAVRWYEATYANGVYTATTTSVKDFYRVRELRFSVAATGRMLIYDLGGSTTIYGVIKATYWEAQLTRFYVQKDYTAWIVNVKVENSSTADAKLKITRTDKLDSLASDQIIEVPKAALYSKNVMHHIGDLSEAKFSIIGNTATVTATITIVEVKDGIRVIGGDLL